MAKSKWEDVKNKLVLVEGWARDGLTDEQIANNLGISIQTFYTYKKEHLEFFESLKKGKEIVDYEVENALLKRALGYEYEEKTYEDVYNKELDMYVEKLTKKVKKQVAPDTTALIFWLKNRKPNQWRDKVNIENESTKETLEKLDEVLKGLGGVV